VRALLLLAFAGLLALAGWAAWTLGRLALDPGRPMRDSSEIAVVAVGCGSVVLVALWLAHLMIGRLRARAA
jgi:hypothetical protein